MSATWRYAGKVREYVHPIGRLEARRAGEVEMLDAVPARVESVLDLGCGDGRLAALVMSPTQRSPASSVNRLIGRQGGDPEDVLPEVEPQLAWMRAAGLSDVG